MGDKDKPEGQVIEFQFGGGSSPKDRGTQLAEHNARVLEELGIRNTERAEDLRARLIEAVQRTPLDGVRVLGVDEGDKVVRLVPPSQDDAPEGWLIADQSGGEIPQPEVKVGSRLPNSISALLKFIRSRLSR